MSAQPIPERNALARYSPSYLSEHQPPPPANDGSQEESLKSVWTVLRKRKMWIGLATLAGILLAALVCIFLPRQYSGTATIQASQDDSSEVSLTHNPAAPAAPDDLKTQMATHIGVLTSDSIALAVVQDLNLQKYKPFAFKPTIVGFFTGTNAQIEAEQKQGLPLDQASATRERILEIFSKKLDVKNTPDTRLLTVSFMNPDPKLAAAIANDVVAQYIRFEARSQSTSQASKWLSAQLNDLKNKVTESQNQLAAYEKKTGLNSLLLNSLGQGGSSGGATHIPALDKLDALNQEVVAAEQNRLSKEAIYHLTQTENPSVVVGLGSSNLPGIANSAVVAQGNGLDLLQNLRQQQATLKLAYADASTKYGAKNPRLMEIQNQLSDINQQVVEELKTINRRARNDYLLAQENENGLKHSFTDQQAQAAQLNQDSVQLELLAQEAASRRALYDGLYSKLQETNVQAGIRATNIGVADPARASATPTRPNPPLYLAIGLAAGLLFGISSAFMREHMDETVRTPLQVDPAIPFPVLANIPLVRSPGLSLSGSSLNSRRTEESSLLITQPRSPVAEAYRALRTAIQLSSGAGPLHTLLVTSPLVGEGKTSVAYNTAVAFAHAGKQVLLVDADMRKPQLHTLFGVSKSPGLCDVLASGQPVDALIRQHSTVPNLSLLPAGTTPSLPSELLGSRSFDDLMQHLQRKFSLIILDSPPMLLVTDAIVLSEKVDATLAVVRAGVTTDTVLQRLSEALERNGSRAVGLVLNGVDTNSVDYYMAYGHNGGKYYEETNV